MNRPRAARPSRNGNGHGPDPMPEVRTFAAPGQGRPDFGVQGRTGLKEFSGFVYEEFLPELVGKRGIETIGKMLLDPVISGILFALEMLMRQVQWPVLASTHPDADEGTADEARLFVEQAFDDMAVTWPDTISDILTFIPYGWSFFEQLFKQRLGSHPEDPTKDSKFNDGKIGWRQFSIRSQESLWKWVFDDSGQVTGLIQRPPPTFQTFTVDSRKALHFRSSATKGNPEGRSVLRGAYRPWYFKQNIEVFEAIGIERDLAGLPLAKVPIEIMYPSADANQQAIYQQIKEMVTRTRRDEQEGIIIPRVYDRDGNEMYDFQLLTSGGSRQFDTDKVIGRKNTEMALTVLADFILLGHENVGSFALSANKTALFSVAVNAWLDMICEVVNLQGIAPLCELNGWTPENFPTLGHGSVENADLATLGDYVQKLAAAGVPLFPNVELEKYLLEQAGLPVPSDEDMERKNAAQQSLLQTANKMVAEDTSSTDGAADGAAPAAPPAKPAEPLQPQAAGELFLDLTAA